MNKDENEYHNNHSIKLIDKFMKRSHINILKNNLLLLNDKIIEFISITYTLEELEELEKLGKKCIYTLEKLVELGKKCTYTLEELGKIDLVSIAYTLEELSKIDKN
ncbi:hypothetical protein BCR32DRAFT_281621 [Anaeromyces robustus]|uniref:Uncharacterized protein n=1 Tax=Anaeromyces robustus TaxID=1754192 RepID=A0A1Y1X021_9FUNG|nr:hypothetical protein BCR32DRAFT_281621 [Anaeromyces robustus]|eukprot:ORX79179.1 hypothetical protein BCR32DRAFT_281621 [Anaeromyces robustus]